MQSFSSFLDRKKGKLQAKNKIESSKAFHAVLSETQTLLRSKKLNIFTIGSELKSKGVYKILLQQVSEWVSDDCIVLIFLVVALERDLAELAHHSLYSLLKARAVKILESVPIYETIDDEAMLKIRYSVLFLALSVENDANITEIKSWIALIVNQTQILLLNWKKKGVTLDTAKSYCQLVCSFCTRCVFVAGSAAEVVKNHLLVPFFKATAVYKTVRGETSNDIYLAGIDYLDRCLALKTSRAVALDSLNDLRASLYRNYSVETSSFADKAAIMAVLDSLSADQLRELITICKCSVPELLSSDKAFLRESVYHIYIAPWFQTGSVFSMTEDSVRAISDCHNEAILFCPLPKLSFPYSDYNDMISRNLEAVCLEYWTQLFKDNREIAKSLKSRRYGQTKLITSNSYAVSIQNVKYTDNLFGQVEAEITSPLSISGETVYPACVDNGVKRMTSARVVRCDRSRCFMVMDCLNEKLASFNVFFRQKPHSHTLESLIKAGSLIKTCSVPKWAEDIIVFGKTSKKNDKNELITFNSGNIFASKDIAQSVLQKLGFKAEFELGPKKRKTTSKSAASSSGSQYLLEFSKNKHCLLTPSAVQQNPLFVRPKVLPLKQDISQFKAVLSGINELNTLISGPRRSGKTQTLLQIARVLSQFEEKTLIVVKDIKSAEAFYENLRQLTNIYNPDLLLVSNDQYQANKRELAGLLDSVNKLAQSLNIEGYHGNNCETAMRFYEKYIEQKIHECDSVQNGCGNPFAEFFKNYSVGNYHQCQAIKDIFHSINEFALFEVISDPQLVYCQYITKSKIVILTVSDLVKYFEQVKEKASFENVIIDDASHLTPLESLVSLSLGSELKRWILAGDVTSKSANVTTDSLKYYSDLDTSLFERVAAKNEVVVLEEKY